MSIRTYVRDGFVNLLTGLGVVGQDARQSATPGGPLTFQRQTLDNMYASDDIVARLCDLPAQTMTRKWLQLSGVDDPTAAAEVLEAGRKLQIQRKVRKAITWGRLHGTALVIMIIDDGREMDKPVDEENIRAVESLMVLDRWDLKIHQTVEEFGDRFGEPESYEILMSAATSITGIAAGGKATAALLDQPIVHASRVLRFDGVETPRQRKRDLQGFNDSAVTRVYEVLRDYQSSYGGAAASMQNMGAMIYKIKELSKVLAADKDNLVLSRLQLLNQAKGAFNMIPLDADGESVEPLEANYTAARDILERWDQRLAAAIGWPVTVLMGRSPAGMNATGENDLAIFYDTMEGLQADETDKLEVFYRYLQRSKEGPTKGKELEGWAAKWNKLWQESQGEQAKTRLTIAQADALNIDRDVYTAEEAANSHYAGDEFQIDVELDQEAREAQAEIEPADEIPGQELRPPPNNPPPDDEGGDDEGGDDDQGDDDQDEGEGEG